MSWYGIINVTVTKNIQPIYKNIKLDDICNSFNIQSYIVNNNVVTVKIVYIRDGRLLGCINNTVAT